MTTVAIITGASQGIGRATAIRLARDFTNIVLVARNKDKLQETASLLKMDLSRLLILDLDLAEPTSANIIVTRTLEKFKQIDALVNIAGAVPQIDLFDMTDAQWDGGLAVKLHGARRLAICAWDALKTTHGSVVFTSGNSAVAPKAPFAAVATINAAIVALSKAFADRGIKDGVQVNSMLPGPVLTNRRRTYMEKWALAHDMSVEEAMKRFPEDAGIGRFGEAGEIAELVAFLVSPAAKWMTGSSVRMDGGEVESI